MLIDPEVKIMLQTNNKTNPNEVILHIKWRSIIISDHFIRGFADANPFHQSFSGQNSTRKHTSNSSLDNGNPNLPQTYQITDDHYQFTDDVSEPNTEMKRTYALVTKCNGLPIKGINN